MSSKVVTDVWENSPPDIPIDELCLLALLAEYADPDARFCFPKVPTLAKKLHVSVWKTQEMIRALIERGVVVVYECRGFFSLYYIQDFFEPMTPKPDKTWGGHKYTLRQLAPRKKRRSIKDMPRARE